MQDIAGDSVITLHSHATQTITFKQKCMQAVSVLVSKPTEVKYQPSETGALDQG